MLAGRGQEAERERLLQEQLAAEREKRVAHLQQLGVRRLMQQGLARGWTAWLDIYLDYQHKKRMLKTAASRLSKPKLVASFVKWQRDWEAEEAAKATMSHEQRLADANARASTAEAENEKLQAELAKAREAMLAGVGLEAERERLAQEELEREREKRVAHLQQLGVRRLMQQGLARGWTAWLDIYLDYQHKKRMLKTAASRLSKPKLVASFVKWQRDWEAEEAAKATMSHAQRLAEMDAKRAAAEADADALRHELAKAREAMLSGRGREEEMARLAQEELEREREKRVQHLQQLGVRRLIQQGLARGWTTWVDGYRDLQRKRRLLAAAAGRLSKPKLVAAFVHWQRDWEVEEAAKAALLEKTTSEERAEQERILREALENNVKLLQMELAEARAAALAGVGQEAELKRLMQQKLEEERQKRIEHLHGSAIRRMLYADIARGWSAWLTFWDEKSRHLRMLRSASSKMTKPKLSAAFAHWHRDWELEQVVKEGMTTQQKYEHQLAMQRAVEATLQDQIFKLKTELMAAREAALAGDGREAEVERLHKLALEQEKEKRVAHLQQMGVRRLLQQGLARGWTAWMDTYREYKHNQFLLRGAANRFARPKLVAAWGRWQRDWDAAIAARERKPRSQRASASWRRSSRSHRRSVPAWKINSFKSSWSWLLRVKRHVPVWDKLSINACWSRRWRKSETAASPTCSELVRTA